MYSFGVVLYELYNGHLPYPGDEGGGLWHRRRQPGLGARLRRSGRQPGLRAEAAAGVAAGQPPGPGAAVRSVHEP